MNASDNQATLMTEIQNILNSSGVRRPASQIVKDLDTAALISKMVRPHQESLVKISEPESGNSAILNNGVDQISKSIMLRKEDNENVFKLFPDIELSVQILISSILSPKDMVQSDLIFRAKDSKLPPSMVAKMIKYLKTELETHYKLSEEAPEILRDALFLTGSHVKLLLPESAVDALINQNQQITTESIYSTDLFMRDANGQMRVKSLGILGDPRSGQQSQRTFALESIISPSRYTSYETKLYVESVDESIAKDYADINISAFKNLMSDQVEVTDNFHCLKIPKLAETAAKTALSTHTHGTMARVIQESFADTDKKMTPKELEQVLYKQNQADYKPFIAVPASANLKRRSVGRGFRMTIPSEAAIPVYVPGNFREHIGYFIPTDMDGNPVTIEGVSSDSAGGLATAMQSEKAQTAISSLLTDKARRNLDTLNHVPMLDRITDLYANIIERDLLERLLRGRGQKLSVGRNNEFYRVMLSRTLQAKMTRLIYVPAEYITYFAFNFHRNGVGKSYLDDLSNITSLRAMILFSKVMAKIKSSISVTDVLVQLDERDPDPQKTIEQAKHLVARSRQQFFPHGLNRVVDLTNWLQAAGIQIRFEGHPRLPKTRFEFENKNVQHTEPDSELDEQLRYQTYMHFGLSPETVDSAAKTEFATTIENQSVLFSRRVTMLSNIFSRDMTDYGRKIIRTDEVILKDLVEIMKEHRGELEASLSDEELAMYKSDPVGFTTYILDFFLETFEIDLPKPESTKTQNQVQALEAEINKVEKALEFIFSSDVLPSELAGEANNYVEAAKASWKAAIIRRWMADNNFAPEVFEITNCSEEGRPMSNLLEISKSHTQSVMLNIVSFLKAMKSSREASDKDLEKINAGESSGGDDDYSSGDDSGSSDNFDDFDGGDDPFANPEIGGDDDLPPEDAVESEGSESPEKENQDEQPEA